MYDKDIAEEWAEDVLIQRRMFGFPSTLIETAGLPEPCRELPPPVDDESIIDERRFQGLLDRTIDRNALDRAHIDDDQLRTQLGVRQSKFITAERMLRPVVGSGGDEGEHFLKPEDGPYDPAPTAATDFVVTIKKRRMASTQ